MKSFCNSRVFRLALLNKNNKFIKTDLKYFGANIQYIKKQDEFQLENGPSVCEQGHYIAHSGVNPVSEIFDLNKIHPITADHILKPVFFIK